MPQNSKINKIALAFFTLSIMLNISSVNASVLIRHNEDTNSLKFFKSKNKGLVDDKLGACPDSPNCVLSENHATSKQSINSIEFATSSIIAWQNIQVSILSIGGKIVAVDDEYLHATFVSRIMRYVDDVELRLDATEQQIHMRSISRVGYSDLGANRRRMEALRSTFNKID